MMAPNGAVPRGPPPVTCGCLGDGRASPALCSCVGQRRRSPPPPLGGRGRRREVEMSGVYGRPRVQPLAGCLTEAKSTCGDFSSSCWFLLPRSAGKSPRGELSVKKWLFFFQVRLPFSLSTAAFMRSCLYKGGHAYYFFFLIARSTGR